MRLPPRLLVLGLGALALPACVLPHYGTNPSLDDEASGGTTSTAGSGGVAGSSAGSAAVDGGAGSAGTGNPEAGAPDDAPPLTPLPGELRRLTGREYEATASDLLGTTFEPDLGAFTSEVDGFDNVAAANGVDEPLYLRYLETAEELADEVFASAPLRGNVVTCAAADDEACVRQVLSQTGLRLFRRPLFEDEIVIYVKVYERARLRELTHDESLRDVLVALLASAQFLYRAEVVPEAPGEQPVTPFDLASRLSYLLWSSAPDDTLLDAASNDALATNEQLSATVDRLLADVRAQRFVQSFGGQWLGARRVAALTFDPLTHPQWTSTLATAAAGELDAYFAAYVQEDRDFGEFLNDRTHYVNAELAPLYGLTAAGDALQPMQLSGQDRRGFLGMVGFLALTAQPARSSPSRRGSWILQNLLCRPLEPAPIDMPLFVKSPDTIRSYLEALVPDPDCGACHEQFDGLGLALENYDAIGQFRTKYPNATAIDPSVTLPSSAALPDGVEISGAAGLSAAVAGSGAFTACAAQKLYSYGFGRQFSAQEAANVQALAAQWRSGSLTLRELILRLVQSPAFRSRSDGGDL